MLKQKKKAVTALLIINDECSYNKKRPAVTGPGPIRRTFKNTTVVRQNKAAAAAQQACKGLDAQLEIARKQLAACREGGYECMWAQKDQL